MNAEQLKQAAMAATPELIADVDPAVILALLECVDALRALMDDDADLSEGYWCDWSDKARAALQKLEAL